MKKMWRTRNPKEKMWRTTEIPPPARKIYIPNPPTRAAGRENLQSKSASVVCCLSVVVATQESRLCRQKLNCDNWREKIASRIEEE